MKNFLPLLLLCLILLLGCKNEQEKLKEKLAPIIAAAALKDSLVTKIDSIFIYKIDTLTALKDSISKLSMLLDRRDLEISSRKHTLTMAGLESQSAEISLSQAKLYRSTFGRGALSDITFDEAKSHLKKSKEYITESEMYEKRVDYYHKRIDNILNLQKSKKIDSIEFKGYIVKYRLRGSDKDNVAVKLDSMQNMINPDLRIISYGNINRN